MACQHISESVEFDNLSTVTVFEIECEKCNQPAGNKNDATLSGVCIDFLWMCLACGNQACGRKKNRHAMDHFQATGRKHALVVDMCTWKVWCYLCSSYVALPNNDTRALEILVNGLQCKQFLYHKKVIQTLSNVTVLELPDMMANSTLINVSENSVCVKCNMVTDLYGILMKCCQCNAYYHLRCASITPALHRWMILEDMVSRWRCEKCV